MAIICRCKRKINGITKMFARKSKVITGIRRCGKSYLLRTLFKSYLLSEGVAVGQGLQIVERIIECDFLAVWIVRIRNFIRHLNLVYKEIVLVCTVV